ncbi:CLUMA_CG014120, isoform A [Clunio marinus]|uniref:CLUMA_CG014120, isoform A n=1 Tax=Clunio marinus TaxID=568069 RepID=A0A1J1IKV6_9DIPT|nr:CLUMA_CG014120, isoform A [Clunio marinus]
MPCHDATLETKEVKKLIVARAEQTKSVVNTFIINRNSTRDALSCKASSEKCGLTFFMKCGLNVWKNFKLQAC